MTTLTVLLLVAMWAAVLVPGAWRDRRNSPRSTVDGFHAAMERLATCDNRTVLVHGGPGREVHPARSARQDLIEYRRMVLARLLGLVGATFLTALVAGGGLWWSLFALATVACGGYIAALRALAVRREQTRAVVRLHPAHRARVAARRMMEEYARASADRTRAADARRAAGAEPRGAVGAEPRGAVGAEPHAMDAMPDTEHELPFAVGQRGR